MAHEWCCTVIMAFLCIGDCYRKGCGFTRAGMRPWKILSGLIEALMYLWM